MNKFSTSLPMIIILSHVISCSDSYCFPPLEF